MDQGIILKSEKYQSKEANEIGILENDNDALRMRVEELENFIEFKSKENNQVNDYYRIAKEEIDNLHK